MKEPLQSFAERIVRNNEISEFITGLLVEMELRGMPTDFVSVLVDSYNDAKRFPHKPNS